MTTVPTGVAVLSWGNGASCYKYLPQFPTLFILLVALYSCGSTILSDLNDPLIPIPTDVEPHDVIPPRLQVLWSIEYLDEPRPAVVAPAVGLKSLVVAYKDEVEGYDLGTGVPLWTATLDTEIDVAPVWLSDHIAVHAGSSWWLLDPTEGTIVDRLPQAETPLAVLAVDGDIVQILSASVQRLVIGGEGWSTPVESPGSLAITPDGHSLLVGTSSGSLIRIEVAGGMVAWELSTGTTQAPGATADTEHAYFVNGDTRPASARLDSGKVTWRAHRLGSAVLAAPAVVNGIVWLAGLDGSVHGFDARSGTALFNVSLPSRTYIDLVVVEPWVLVSPQYGPWKLGRVPHQELNVGSSVLPAFYDVPAQTELELPPALGPQGVALIDANGSLYYLTEEQRPPNFSRTQGSP